MTEQYEALRSAKKFPIDTHKLPKIRIIFIYGIDFVRISESFDMFYFWNGGYLWVLTTLILGSIILYNLRRSTGLQAVNFVAGFLEMVSIIFGGGNIRYQHQLEKWFFAIGLTASFFLVSLYLADFSVQSILFRGSLKVDTFEELEKHNVTFGLSSHLAKYKNEIADMIRLAIQLPTLSENIV